MAGGNELKMLITLALFHIKTKSCNKNIKTLQCKNVADCNIYGKNAAFKYLY